MANKDPGGLLPDGTVSFMEEIERIEMVEFGMEEDAEEVEKIQHDPTLSNAQRVNKRVRHDKKSCWSTLDEQEASLALKICPCTTCREHHYGGGTRCLIASRSYAIAASKGVSCVPRCFGLARPLPVCIKICALYRFKALVFGFA